MKKRVEKIKKKWFKNRIFLIIGIILIVFISLIVIVKMNTEKENKENCEEMIKICIDNNKRIGVLSPPPFGTSGVEFIRYYDMEECKDKENEFFGFCYNVMNLCFITKNSCNEAGFDTSEIFIPEIYEVGLNYIDRYTKEYNPEEEYPPELSKVILRFYVAMGFFTYPVIEEKTNPQEDGFEYVLVKSPKWYIKTGGEESFEIFRTRIIKNY
jgi:hypothetical protein